MSSLQAGSLVIGLILLVGGPIIYWIFFKMDKGVEFPIAAVEPPKSLTANEIAEIEEALRVTLPQDFVTFLTKGRNNIVDHTTVMDDAATIIEATMDYRGGVEDLPSWPDSLVYIGDEEDACPYVIDSESGRVMHLDKGNFGKPPLSEFVSFSAFLEKIEGGSALNR
ncbi:SMI1/KNR4 family protein [Verrucomicrobiales bacterium]|nr:SMI1/KNR4 family protein [Verrucomicrobiales bacterium]